MNKNDRHDTRQSFEFLFLLCFRRNKHLEESRILFFHAWHNALYTLKLRIVSIDFLIPKHLLLSININSIYHESAIDDVSPNSASASETGNERNEMVEKHFYSQDGRFVEIFHQTLLFFSSTFPSTFRWKPIVTNTISFTNTIRDWFRGTRLFLLEKSICE